MVIIREINICNFYLFLSTNPSWLKKEDVLRRNEITVDNAGLFVSLQKEGDVECIALWDSIFCILCSIWLL